MKMGCFRLFLAASVVLPAAAAAQPVPFEGQWSQLQAGCSDGRTAFTQKGSKEILGGQVLTRCTFTKVEPTPDGYSIRSACRSATDAGAARPETWRLIAIGPTEMTLVYPDGIRVLYRRCPKPITLPN